ncbi:MAG: sensor histidine kinase, partial [Chitinophagaceae bacterium]
VFAIAKDVTRKKELEKLNEEKYLQFKKLVDHFKYSLEKDKQSLAEELHEELAQTAAVVKLNLDIMLQQVKGKNDVLAQCTEQALKATEQLLTSIRRISYSISPQMLDDVGFSETLSWLCQEFQNLSGVTCTLTCHLDENGISRNQQLELFRICQEALGLVINQAKASNVEMVLKETKNNIELSVMVKGFGFEMDQLTQNLGLTSLRERIASVNGTLFIKSSEQGTQLIFTMASQP